MRGLALTAAALVAGCDPVVYDTWTERSAADEDRQADQDTPADQEQTTDQDEPALVYDIIVDNDSIEGYAEHGEWYDSSGSGHYAGGSRWSATAMDGHWATFTPTIGEQGNYLVSAWWVTGANRAPDAQYRIEHMGGATSVRVNQSQSGSRWNVLDLLPFAVGTGGKVVLTDAAQAGRVVSADAVRFQHARLVEVVVDNSDSGFVASTSWQWSTEATGFLGDGYRRRAVETVSDIATWQATLDVDGDYEVFARWPGAANHTSEAPYLVFHGDGPTTVRVNQQEKGGEWVFLGTFYLQAGTADRINLSCWTGVGEYVVADAVRFLLKTP